MDEANRKNPLETDGRNPLPEHLAARERALYEAAAELERLTDQLFGAEGAGRLLHSVLRLHRATVGKLLRVGRVRLRIRLRCRKRALRRQRV